MNGNSSVHVAKVNSSRHQSALKTAMMDKIARPAEVSSPKLYSPRVHASLGSEPTVTYTAPSGPPCDGLLVFPSLLPHTLRCTIKPGVHPDEGLRLRDCTPCCARPCSPFGPLFGPNYWSLSDHFISRQACYAALGEDGSSTFSEPR